MKHHVNTDRCTAVGALSSPKNIFKYEFLLDFFISVSDVNVER
jgi:hypothetical protein